MSKINFDGQVAIITGAGSGIGRAIALSLAERGAKVVVNNRTLSRADDVVKEITNAGGSAIADGMLIGAPNAGRTIVDKAMKAFGRIDILVNNAGSACHGPFAEVPDEEVDRVLEELPGAYHLTQACWAEMAKQGCGRILNISSSTVLGIGENEAYAAVKGGMFALTRDAAMEGQEAGILVNALWPVAYTRMTERIPIKDIRLWLERNFPPSKVAPVAAYLVSRTSDINGMVFSTGGGRVAQISIIEANGFLEPDITIETVAENIDKIVDPTGEVLDHCGHEMSLYRQHFPRVS